MYNGNSAETSIFRRHKSSKTIKNETTAARNTVTNSSQQPKRPRHSDGNDITAIRDTVAHLSEVVLQKQQTVDRIESTLDKGNSNILADQKLTTDMIIDNIEQTTVSDTHDNVKQAMITITNHAMRNNRFVL